MPAATGSARTPLDQLWNHLSNQLSHHLLHSLCKICHIICCITYPITCHNTCSINHHITCFTPLVTSLFTSLVSSVVSYHLSYHRIGHDIWCVTVCILIRTTVVLYLAWLGFRSFIKRFSRVYRNQQCKVAEPYLYLFKFRIGSRTLPVGMQSHIFQSEFTTQPRWF